MRENREILSPKTMSRPKIIDKEYLIKEYSINKKTGKEIAKEVQCSFAIVYRYLKKYNIRVRTTSESLKGKYIGENAFHYIDGCSLKIYYCIVCKIKEISYDSWLKGSKMCGSCSHKGERNIWFNVKGAETANWKGGKPKCVGCGKEISYRSERCYKCNGEYLSGDNAPGWIDGRSSETYPLEFTEELRESVRKRDNYECQNCGITEEEHFIVIGKSLPIHHIDYDKFNCKEDNLITICYSCNSRANFNRDYWQVFYSEKKKNLYK